jgi:hypothetical protein
MTKKYSNSAITTGDISGNGIALGCHAQASIYQGPTVNVGQIVEMIDDLADLINSHAATLADAEAAGQLALEARTESMNETPHWKRVRELLTKLGPMVAGVASLTAIVNNLRTLIPH